MRALRGAGARTGAGRRAAGSWRRDAGGTVRFERWFSFEYGAPDGDRGHGYVTLLGRHVTAFVLQART